MRNLFKYCKQGADYRCSITHQYRTIFLIPHNWPKWFFPLKSSENVIVCYPGFVVYCNSFRFRSDGPRVRRLRAAVHSHYCRNKNVKIDNYCLDISNIMAYYFKTGIVFFFYYYSNNNCSESIFFFCLFSA